MCSNIYPASAESANSKTKLSVQVFHNSWKNECQFLALYPLVILVSQYYFLGA